MLAPSHAQSARLSCSGIDAHLARRRRLLVRFRNRPANNRSPPGVTQWAPAGARTVGNYDYEIIPQPNAFHTMHVGPNNTDNVWVAVAPQLELDWVSETSFFVPEGPTYDNEGNLYFSPLFPQENVSLVSLDARNRCAQLGDRGQ